MRNRIWRTMSLALVLTIGAAGTAGAATVELLSKANPIPDNFGDSYSPSFSSDGRYVLFGSFSPTLVPGQVDRADSYDLFLHDRVTDTTTLVSHQDGSPTTADSSGVSSQDAALSADGRYVVYTSAGASFSGGIDTSSWNDVFLWDRVTGTTTLVSHAAGTPNVPADGPSSQPRISADGEWVVFTSLAKNLVPGQTEPTVLPGTLTATEDVFLWNRSSGAVTLVSRKSGAPAATGDRSSSRPEISADGNFVAFISEATDLVSGVSDTNGRHDVFVYERSSGTVSLVSRESGGSGTANGLGSWEPRISADGRFIAFASLAGNLVPGQVDTPNTPDAFLFDRVTGEMRLASHTSASPVTTAGIAQYLGLSLSADGRALAFVSEAGNLVPGQVDNHSDADVFVYDRLSGSIELASHTPASPATATAERVQAGYPSLSADGRFVTFSSAAPDLVPDEPADFQVDDVFLYDRSDKSVVLVSRRDGSITDETGFSTFSAISPDGSAIAFSSTTASLGGIFDPNGFSDVLVYSRSSAETAILSRRDPANPAPVTPYGPSSLGDISADGQTILFTSLGAGLVPGQLDEPYGCCGDGFGNPNGTWDAFLVDRAAGQTILLSRFPVAPLQAIGFYSQPVLSADGRFAAFTTLITPVGPFTRGPALQLFDKATNTAILVNHKPGAIHELAPGNPGELAISADGRYLAYSCNGCTALVPGQQSANSGTQVDIFLYDRATRTNTLVSHASVSPVTGANKISWNPAISADGRFVAFQSHATDLAAGQSDVPDSLDVFVFDRMTGVITLVSRSASAPAMTGNQPSWLSGISADGRFIAFRSAATNLVPGQADTNDGIDVFLWDRIDGTMALVSHATSSPTTAGNRGAAPSAVSPVVSLSADGRFMVYESTATDLIAGGVDTNNGPDVFLYDRTTGINTFVSHLPGLPAFTGNGRSEKARISADGRRIAFLSQANDLVAGQAPTGFANLILQDRITGARTLVGRVAVSTSLEDSALVPRMSADGRSVAFTSDSTSFVAGDFNADRDVFLYREGSNGPVTVPPCTLFDTRRPADGPMLRSGTRKILTAHGACGVPAGAISVVVKVTVPEPGRRGNLRLFPGDSTTPAAILRFKRKQTRTGTFTVPLAADGTLALQAAVAGNGAVHVVVEVVGYVE